MIPWHVDYDVSYAVRCICPVYGGQNVINLFKRDKKLRRKNDIARLCITGIDK